MTDFTSEFLQAFHLTLIQPARGARYSLDPLLLAFFVSTFDPVHAIDLGAGVGVAGLVAAAQSSGMAELELVEIQPELAELARENVMANPMDHCRVRVRTEDARYICTRGCPDMILSNPPFRDFRDGRVSHLRQRALSRHWYFLSPQSLFTTARRIQNERGLVCLVLPAIQVALWDRAATEKGFGLVASQAVHHRSGDPETLRLVAWGRQPFREVRDPLILMDESGKYTPEAAGILGII